MDNYPIFHSLPIFLSVCLSVCLSRIVATQHQSIGQTRIRIFRTSKSVKPHFPTPFYECVSSARNCVSPQFNTFRFNYAYNSIGSTLVVVDTRSYSSRRSWL